jgi:hypothetical protein
MRFSPEFDGEEAFRSHVIPSLGGHDQGVIEEDLARFRETLFSRKWLAFLWVCVQFHRTRSSSEHEKLRRAERSVKNHRDKKDLLASGRTHGILVYANGEPVGWCQYGPKVLVSTTVAIIASRYPNSVPSDSGDSHALSLISGIASEV